MKPEKEDQISDQTMEKSQDPTLIPLVAEEVSIGKRRIVTGQVKVATVTKEHEQLVEELLEREHVEIERTPVGREVDKTPPVREEGDTLIVPVMEERVVVERRLVLKEELRIHRTRETQPYQERVIVRKQEAVITRLPDDSNQ